MISRIRHKLILASGFRKPGIVLGLFTLAALLAITTYAESWENKDWTQWTSQDCYHILSASPWYAIGPEVFEPYLKSPGHYGETGSTPEALLVSALVIREALEKQAQYDSHYDKMSPAEKQTFDQQAANCIGRSFTDRIIFGLSGPYMPPSPNAPGNPFRLFIDGKEVPAIGQLGSNAISPCADKTSVTGGGYIYIAFPRFVNGTPVIQPSSKKIVLGNSVKDGFQFNVEKLIYQGKLDY
jgi:hypothetical protein